MPQQFELDFRRRNLLAAAINQVVLAAMQTKESLLIDTANVPRSEPAVGEICAVQLRRIQIARRHGGAADHDFPPHPSRELPPSPSTILIVSGQGSLDGF